MLNDLNQEAGAGDLHDLMAGEGTSGLGGLAALKIPGLSGASSNSNSQMIGTYTQNEILKDIGMHD